jgi:AraC family transcriptional regulator
MHAPFSHSDRAANITAPSVSMSLSLPSRGAAHAVIVEDVAGPPRRIVLPHGRDAIVMPLSATVLSAFPGIAPARAGLGTVLFVPADTCLSAAFEEDHNAIMLLVDPQIRGGFGAALAACGFRVPDTAFLVEGAVHLRALVPMIRRLAAAQDAGAALALGSLAELLLHEIAAAHRNAAAGNAQRPAGSPRLQPRHLHQIDRFIEHNIEGVLRIDDLAALVGLSRYHFLRCFKRATGLSPLQYVLGKRVERARHLLAEGGESIAAIAYATGFSSQSHLNAMFKRHFGITPGAFLRARHGGTPSRKPAERLQNPAPTPALALAAS